MPFLRRRGNVASESDMRRHTLLDSVAGPKKSSSRPSAPWPEVPAAAIRNSCDGNASGGNDGQTVNGLGRSNGDGDSNGPTNTTAITAATAIDGTNEISTNDGEPIGSDTRDSDQNDTTSSPTETINPVVTRSGSPPAHEETPKHRRFSVLRFRNASDSQLSLRAKQHAERPPPVPRRVFPRVAVAPALELMV